MADPDIPALTRAAEQGDGQAAYQLALLLTALGRDQDGEQWLERAAGRGVPDAASNLAKIRAALE